VDEEQSHTPAKGEVVKKESAEGEGCDNAEKARQESSQRSVTQSIEIVPVERIPVPPEPCKGRSAE